MLTDKSGSGVLLYLHSRRTDCDRNYVWTGKARRRSRLFSCCRRWIRGLLCAGWMSVFTVCLHCLFGPRLPDSMHTDSQGAWLGPGNDRDYAKCPHCLSVPSWWWIWYVMEWRRGLTLGVCFQASAFAVSWVSIVKYLKLYIHFLLAICLYFQLCLEKSAGTQGS